MSSRTIYRVIVVDKKADKVLFDGHVVANDTTSAIASVAVDHAKELAGKDLYTYANSLASYNKED